MSKTHSMQVTINTTRSVSIGQMALALKQEQERKDREADKK